MKKLMVSMLLVSPCWLFAQIGVKAGLNFVNVTYVSSIYFSSRSNFHAGLFCATSSKKIVGSKTELLFSRQGYDYESNTNSGKVDLNYLLLPEYLCINITKYFQIQAGIQIGYLLNAKADSTMDYGIGGTYGKILDFYNRLDYGVGGGIEVHPFMGLQIGARVNFSLNSLYKNPDSYSSDTQPSFIPSVDVKNNVIQIYMGWRFGK